MNPNLRIVWDNAADRGQLAASTEAGSLTAQNLRNNLKSCVWRGVSPEESLILSWDEPEPVGCVVLAFNNFTSEATIRLQGFTRAEDLIPEFDIGPAQCAPAAALGQFPWGTPLGENFYARGGASLFAYGYGGYGVLWVPDGRAVQKLVIDIADPGNPDGYIEVGRLIVGPYWEPLHNFDFGHRVTPVDSTQNRRTEGGDLRGERMPKWRKIEFTVSNMDTEDRAALMRLLRHHGTSEPVFLSLFPENEDSLLEQSYQLWGKFTESAGITQPRYDIYTSSLVVEEM